MTSQRSAQEGGPDIEAQASVVREQAQAALGDVRGLIELLRDPYQGTAEHFMDDDSTIGLAQLPQLIDECREAGMTLSTTVWINEAMPIPATVSRATYRVVQEALTNARRHAAGLPVDLEVRVGRPAGVSITVANPLPGGAVDLDGATAAPPEVTGPGRAAHDQGRGLAGIAERARLLGGTSECGPTADGRFVVAVDLPFQTSATD